MQVIIQVPFFLFVYLSEYYCQLYFEGESVFFILFNVKKKTLENYISRLCYMTYIKFVLNKNFNAKKDSVSKG